MLWNHKFNAKTFKQIMEERSTPPIPIIDDGILLEESLLLISAEKKVGKSMLGYNIAIAISEGINFAFFKVPKPRSVLYMTAEGGQYPNEERIRKMGDYKNLSNENLTVVFNPKTLFDDDEKLEEFKALLDDIQPEVVIVDPLIRFHQQDENSSSGMTKIFGILRALMEEYSFALIIIHHLGKDGSKLARGSSAILGEYDSSIVMNKTIRSKRITCNFDMRHVRTPEDKVLHFNEDTFWFEDENGVSPSKFREVLLETGPITRSELCKIAVSKNMYFDESNAIRRIKSEVKQNILKENADGLIVLN